MKRQLTVLAAIALLVAPGLLIAKDAPQQLFCSAGSPGREMTLLPTDGGAFDEETLHYDGDNNDAIGLTAGGTYTGAVRFTPTFACSVKALLFFQYHGSNDEYAFIWGAGTSSQPGAILDSVGYTGAGGMTWKRVDFVNVPLIAANTDFWIGPRITHVVDSFPLGVDAGPMEPTRGGWIYFQGAWSQLADYGLDYDWNIRAIVTPVVLDHDVGVQSISPSGRLRPNQAVDVNAVVKNYGNAVETFDVQCVLDDSTNSVTVFDTIVSTTLGIGETLRIELGQITPPNGTVYHYTVTTMLSGDQNPANDELSARLVARMGSDPDGFGYIYESTQEGDTVTYNWIDPSAGTPITVWQGSSDDGYATCALPFTFRYYDQDLTSINICTNGFLETGTATTYTNAALPQATIPNFIGPFWDDLNPGAGGTVYQLNSTDNSYTVFAWVNVPPYSGAGTLTAEVILDDQGRIRYNYQTIITTTNSNTVGIQGMTGTANWFHQYCNNGAPANHIPAPNASVLFYYPPYLGVTEGPKPAVAEGALRIPTPYTRNAIQLSGVLGKGTAQVYDLTGQVLRSVELGGRNTQLSLDGLNAGMYFVKVATGSVNQIHKLVLVR